MACLQVAVGCVQVWSIRRGMAGRFSEGGLVAGSCECAWGRRFAWEKKLASAVGDGVTGGRNVRMAEPGKRANKQVGICMGGRESHATCVWTCATKGKSEKDLVYWAFFTWERRKGSRVEISRLQKSSRLWTLHCMRKMPKRNKPCTWRRGPMLSFGEACFGPKMEPALLSSRLVRLGQDDRP